MAQLTAAQTQAWEHVLSSVGLSHSAAADSISCSAADGVLSSKPGRKSLAHPHKVKLTSIEQMRALAGGSSAGNVAIPEPWPAAKAGATIDDLDQGDETMLRSAVFVHAVGRGDEVSSYRDVLNRRFFPMPIIVYAGKDIVIKKGCVLTIEPDGHDPVVVNYGSVTLEEGGLIRCEAPVLFIVQRFIKTK
jgi:hypothetical protein